MKKTERIIYLLRGHIEGNLTIDERQELDHWSATDPYYRQLLEETSDPSVLLNHLSAYEDVYGDDRAASLQRMQRYIDDKVSKEESKKKPAVRVMRKWLPYAAAVTLFVIAGITLWQLRPVQKQEVLMATAIEEDVAPGGQKAMLTLSNGSQISLSENQEFIVLQDGDMRYADGTPVLMDEEGEATTTEGQYMSISVPKGGTYQVILSDGTKVWLNSYSSMRYPERFASSRRSVELEGEAYFEVNSMWENGYKVPFIVKTHHQEIEVLGTQFNVAAYNDQQGVVTTLVEGSVAILPNADPSNRFVLKPGYQSIVIGEDSSVEKVEIEQYIAWKDGLFYFKNTSFGDMMNQIAKWYDIEVVYKNNVPADTFTGKMSRSLSLMSILELLNVSNVSVRIEGRTLIVN